VKHGPRRERNWQPASLGQLGLDQVATLLAGEVERLAARSPADGSGGESWERALAPILSRIETLHGEAMNAIAAARETYAGLPAPALARFQDFEREYERRHRALLKLAGDARRGRSDAAPELAAFLRAAGAWKPPPAVPRRDELPRRRLAALPRLPRMTPEEWEARRDRRSARAGVEGARPRGGIFDEIFGSRAAFALDAEGAAGGDLAETPEVLFAPAKAPQLNRVLDEEDLRGSPARIAAWVRDNIEFVPIWGALQSSETVVTTRRGTAMDIASLVIAMLRASGVRARYAAGTVRVPIDEAMNWLGGFTDASAAASLLAGGGTPAAVQVGPDGKPAALRLEHVWVSAFVDWVPSRGACHVEGDLWVDIDASVKAHDYFPRTDLTGLAAWEELRRYVEASIAACTIDESSGEYRCAGDPVLEDSTLLSDEIEELLRENAGSLSAREMLGLGRIRPSPSESLSPGLAAEVIARGWERAALEDDERFRVTIALRRGGEDVLELERAAASLGDSRFSIFFEPASEIDRRILADQFPDARDAYLPETFYVAGVKLVPHLREDGRTIATGPPLDMGADLELTVDCSEPALRTAPIRMSIVAGELTALAIDRLQVPPPLFDRIAAEVRSVTEVIEKTIVRRELPIAGADLAPGEFLEALLSAAAHMWFAEVDSTNEMLASALGAVTHRYPSAGICSAKWRAGSVLGLPLTATHQGVTMHVPGDVTLTVSRDGDPARAVLASIHQGFAGSGLEGSVPSQVFHFGEQDPAYFAGTTQVLGLVQLKGARLALVDAENVELLLQRWSLSAESAEEIRDAVGRGFSVLAHSGGLEAKGAVLAGYAILDLQTGGGTYRMSRTGTAGGEVVDCIASHQPPSSTVYNLTRAWQEAVESNAGEVLLERLEEEGPSVSAAMAILDSAVGTFNVNMGNANAAFAVLGEDAQPLAGLVMLFTMLDVINSLFDVPGLGEVIGVAQKVAWRGVINVIKYRIRTEAQIAGIDIPTDCLNLIEL
jgi:hypothetical protein